MITLLALLILFAPVRYRLEADGKAPEFKAEGRLHFLLHILNAEADFDIKNGVRIRVRLFCIKLYTKVIHLPGKTDSEKRNLDAEEVTSEEGPGPEETKPEQKDEQKSRGAADKTGCGEDIIEIQPVPVSDYKPEMLSDEELSRILEEDGDRDESESAQTESIHSKNFAENIEALLQKFRKLISGIKDYVKTALSTVRDFIRDSRTKVREVKDKINKAAEFKDKPENRRAFALIINKLKIFAYHIRPRKAEGRLRLGLEDPSATGEITGLYYMLFPYLGDSFKFTAEFDEAVIEGSGYLKGHIRLNHALVLFLLLWRNDTIRSWFKK